ncbi:hypothetical protein D9611_012352 [Ephemerocybe angulata]|uniref:Uncharacterized protein n=1 Tax=Ephemerocybe angulata TaxID=980116 RepID=A0A8H5CDW0_9AGAR|nr:hypothetical protein D9611_012352 [Tulosesus angulatus]
MIASNSSVHSSTFNPLPVTGMTSLSGSNILIAVAEEEDSHEQLFEDGVALIEQYETTSDLDDLATAVSTLRRAVELTPHNYPDMASRLANLGTSLWSRFEQTGDHQDIAEAISAEQRALELTPEGHPDMAERLANLGTSIHSRFEHTGDLQDLAQAISMKQRQVWLSFSYITPCHNMSIVMYNPSLLL